jgi:hypothetical protein
MGHKRTSRRRPKSNFVRLGPIATELLHCGSRREGQFLPRVLSRVVARLPSLLAPRQHKLVTVGPNLGCAGGAGHTPGAADIFARKTMSRFAIMNVLSICVRFPGRRKRQIALKLDALGAGVFRVK